MDIPLITVQITPDIAAKLLFMSESGLFSIQKGNATLNFDAGQLKSIKTELYSYPHLGSVDSLTLEAILK